MKTALKVIVVILSMIGAGGQVNASTVPTGVVTSVIAANTFGLAYFTTGGNRSTKPACATTDNWVINIATPQGQAAYAAALTAKVAGSKVTIVGAGDCTNDPTGETVQLIILN